MTAEFADKDWDGRDLGADAFDRTTFVDVDMTDATSRGANFSDCTLRRVRFNSSTHHASAFTNCTFSQCSFFGTTFEDCKLIGSTFTRCTFTNLEVRRRRLVVRRLVGPRPSQTCPSPDCACARPTLAGVRGRSATFRDLDLSGASFRAADFVGADLRGSDLTDLDPLSAQLRGARVTWQQAVQLTTSLGSTWISTDGRPQMKGKVGLVTLGVSDLERSRLFYEALGWRTHDYDPAQALSSSNSKAPGSRCSPGRILPMMRRSTPPDRAFVGSPLPTMSRRARTSDRAYGEALAAGARSLRDRTPRTGAVTRDTSQTRMASCGNWPTIRLPT